MSLCIAYRRLDYDSPPAAEPAFASKVDRWYQLDAPALGFAAAAHEWTRDWERPELLLLASPAGCADTDRDFVEKGALSPAKFVHTLPSVRSSAFCQVAEWAGPMLCLQAGSATILSGFVEACALVGTGASSVWLLAHEIAGAAHRVHGFRFTSGPLRGGRGIRLLASDREPGRSTILTDADFLNWLGAPSAARVALCDGRGHRRQVEQV